MKKLIAMLTVLCLLAAMAPAFASMYDPNAQTMYVKTQNGGKLNLREADDDNAPVLAKIPYGASVLMYSDYAPNNWAHVQYGMMNGFVHVQYLVDYPPEPFVTPVPQPTVKPTPKATATPVPTPEELRTREITAARNLGLVPRDMKSEGSVTWQELDALLTNAIRLKNKNSTAARTHVYLTLPEYQAAKAGAEFNIVLRGVAAAEMYGALIDMGETDPALNHSNDPYIVDAADIDLTQQYAGRTTVAGSPDWREKSLLEMVITILDHADGSTGKAVLEMDMEHEFLPTHPMTRADAIIGVYRLYNSFYTFMGTVTVTHSRQANLRAEPSMKAAIIGKVNPHEIYPVVDIPNNGWYHIQLPDGKTCYIAAGMVSFSRN